MQFYLVFGLLVAVLLQAEAKRCRSEDDCDEGECCIARGIFSLRRGDCRKLAALDESCSLEEETVSFFDTTYLQHCPCAAGLSCEPTEVRDVPFIGTVRINDRCISGTTEDPRTTAEEPETTEPVTYEPVTTEPEPEPETEEPVDE